MFRGTSNNSLGVERKSLVSSKVALIRLQRSCRPRISDLIVLIFYSDLNDFFSAFLLRLVKRGRQ